MMFDSIVGMSGFALLKKFENVFVGAVDDGSHVWHIASAWGAATDELDVLPFVVHTRQRRVFRPLHHHLKKLIRHPNQPGLLIVSAAGAFLIACTGI